MASTSLGRLYVDLLMKTGSFETDAGRAAKIAEKRAREIDRAFDKSLSKVKGAFGAAGAAALGFVAAFASVQAVGGALKAAIDSADQLDELSARLGVSTEKLSAWGYAGKMAGTDLEQIAAAIPKLSKSIAEAADDTSQSAGLFRALGIDVKDAEGKLRDVEDVLPDISDRFKALTSDTQEQAIAQRLLGESGVKMLEFLNLGSDGLQRMEDRARSLGIVLGAEVTGRAAAFNDRLVELQAVTQGISTDIASGMLPNLSDAVVKLTEMGQEGELAANATVLLNTAVNLGVGLLEGYNNAVSRVGLSLEVVVGFVEGLDNAQRGLLTFDYERVAAGWERISSAYTGAQLRLDEMNADAAKAPTLAPIFFTGEASPEVLKLEAENKQLEARVAAFMANAKTPKASGGKRAPALTEQQKEIADLERAYKSLTLQQAERNAASLFEIETGEKVGEAWKAAYDIQFGAMAKLKPLQKLQLMVNAEAADFLEYQKDGNDALKARTADFKKYLANIHAETEALGLTNKELRIRNDLQKLGLTAGSPQGMQVIADGNLLATAEQMASALDGVRDVAYDFFVDLPNGASDAWKNALASIESMLLQWAAKGLVEQLFGQMGTNGQGNTGGLFGEVLGGIFGGGEGNTAGGIFASIFGGGRADGGPVMGGKMYEVNERGMPELLNIGSKQLLMMPAGQGGQVTPMRAGRGGGGFTQVIHQHFANPVEHRTREQMASKLAFESNRALSRNS